MIELVKIVEKIHQLKKEREIFSLKLNEEYSKIKKVWKENNFNI